MSVTERPPAPRPRSVTNGTRIPPHDLDVERALLGALLLSPIARAEVMAMCAAEDFYAPAHAAVFDAVGNLDGRGEPIELVTVGAALRRSGADDGVLVEIVGATGTTTNARDYARLVGEMAGARRMIGAAYELAEAGWANDLAGASKVLEGLGRVVERSGSALFWEDVSAVMRGDVEMLRPEMLVREDGQGLVYAGLSHWLYGPPGTGKTWVALYLAAETLARGGRVVYLDWEGNRRIVGSRLLALGCSADEVAERFHYRRPGPLTTADTGSIRSAGAHLVVYDGVAKALARQGLDEDRASDVLAWLEMAVNPATEAGAAALILDHVTKAADSRDWARGSGAKLGEVSGAAWELRPVSGFSRSAAGRVNLIQRKDREGWVGTDGDTVATIEVVPRGERIEVAVRVPGEFLPSATMEAICKAIPELQAVADQATLRKITKVVPGNLDSTIKPALSALVNLGHLQVSIGPRNSQIYEVITPYRAPASEPVGPVDDEELF